MATANDVLTKAFRRIKVLAGEETLDSADAVDGLSTMNDLMFGFGPKGVSYVHSALIGTTVVNVPDEQIANLVWLVAESIAPDYGYAFTPGEQAKIISAWNEMQAAYHLQPEAVPEPMLRRRRFGGRDITRLD